MNEKMNLSVLVYTLDYPERTERCMEALRRQRNVQLDIKVLAAKAEMKNMKKCFSQISEDNFFAAKKTGLGKVFSSIIESCRYERILLVSSDAFFEEDAFEKMLACMGTSDGFVCNLSVLRTGFKCVSIYPEGFYTENIFLNRATGAGEEEEMFSPANLYTSSPNVWNNIFRKDILLRKKIFLDDFTRTSQYYFVAKYHSYCSELKVNTSIYCYREYQGKKILPGTGFCTKHYFDSMGVVRRGYKRYNPDVVRLLSNDFRISAKQAVIAVQDKMKEKNDGQ